jgi:hypothetical protein
MGGVAAVPKYKVKASEPPSGSELDHDNVASIGCPSALSAGDGLAGDVGGWLGGAIGSLFSHAVIIMRETITHETPLSMNRTVLSAAEKRFVG